MISVSAHKLHGPRGVGFLYASDRVKLKPLLYGGGQENGLRSGTENLPAICGFGTAAAQICGGITDNLEAAQANRQIFIDAIRNGLRTYVFNTPFEQGTDPGLSSPYILNAAFPGLRAEVILHTLEKFGVYVSVGSACSSHKKDRSRVLTAMGLNYKVIDGAIRISLSPDNTREQCEYAAAVLVREVKQLYALHSRTKTRKTGA